MMGCLAALSLAGCGGSGAGGSGASSSGPSESLIIGAGYCMELKSPTSGYTFRLSPNKSCELSIRSSEGNLLHVLEGTWSVESKGNGKFELSLTNFTDSINPKPDCTISVTPSVNLTIFDYSKYCEREQEVDAKFDLAPFTHNLPSTSSGTTCGYSGSVNSSCKAKQTIYMPG